MSRPRMRTKSAPKLGGAAAPAIATAIENMVRWAIANGVDNSLDRNVLGRGSPNDFLAAAMVLANVHLHAPNDPSCPEVPCKKAAICRALRNLLDGYEAPLAAPIREIAQALFDASATLTLVSARLEPRLREAGKQLDGTLALRAGEMRAGRRQAKRQLRGRGLPPLPGERRGPPGHLEIEHAHDLLCVSPGVVAAELRDLTEMFAYLEQTVRGTLKHPSDHLPRTGGRPLDGPVAFATRALHVGGFTVREIADLFGEAGDVADRIKRVHERLHRLEASVKKARRGAPGLLLSREELAATKRPAEPLSSPASEA